MPPSARTASLRAWSVSMSLTSLRMPALDSAYSAPSGMRSHSNASKCSRMRVSVSKAASNLRAAIHHRPPTVCTRSLYMPTPNSARPTSNGLVTIAQSIRTNCTRGFRLLPRSLTKKKGQPNPKIWLPLVACDQGDCSNRSPVFTLPLRRRCDVIDRRFIVGRHASNLLSWGG